jgi:hypothetical protein
MAIGHIDLDKIRANREQKKEDLEKFDKQKQVNLSNAISKLYKDKTQIDNSKNVTR